jgi:NADPH-dependent 2,4-dienoyl-CoA reductase/sulfur reductase-like enzyme/nitrite reductase/ring-hydroxylating ferredoxin subunit
MSTSAQEYLVAKTSDLKNNDKKEVDVPGTEHKVLLIKQNDQFFATSPKCTHYGAPLSKGVLSEGRIVCPWHGACFKISTGDIEDAPAIDAIISFPTTIKGGEVYITAEEKDLAAGRRPPCKSKKAETDEHVVVIGGGAAGTTTAEGLREYGFKGKVTVLSSESYYPIDRTKLSKALIADANKIALRDAAFYKDLDIDFKKSTTVESVDIKAKSVALADGGKLEYSKLVLALGGTPKRLPMDGFDLENVFVLRSVEHAGEIVAARGDSKKNIVIVGSSFIGMEAAYANAKDHNVTVIGMEKYPIMNVLGEQIGKQLLASAEKAGIKFYMEAGVEKALAKGDSKNASHVLLKDGTELPADLVILGVGVAPATKFLAESGLKLEKDGGIEVDGYLQVKGQSDIYAAGDIAQFPYTGPGAEGKPIRIEHWDVAQNHGRAIAKTLAGKKEEFKNVPYFWSAQSGQLRYCGNNSPAVGWDDLVIQGSLEESKFAGFYTKGDTVVAVVSMGYDPVVSKASELMRAGTMPEKKKLQDGLDIRELN